MATGEYLEGILDGIPYRISDEMGSGRSFEEKLKSNLKITEGEFYFFNCNEDVMSNRLRCIKELSDSLKNERQSKPGKYIVQIIPCDEPSNQNNDFGYAALKLFENFLDLTKKIIRIERSNERTQIFITNGGVEHLIDSVDAFDFYRRIFLSSRGK